jgi:4-amino-4-deoxy-L-arabinose transferase-like glycosyltransferase
MPADPAAAGARPAESRRDLLLVAILAALLFLPGLGHHDLWNPDEPRYTEVAREMRQSGDYIVPHLNGEVYSQKPPLQMWAMLAAAAVTGGLDETAARLPAALAAIGTVLLVFRIGFRLFGRGAAALSAAVFATASHILWQGRVGQIDMLLIFLVTLAVWFWVRAWTEQRPALNLLFFAAAGLGTLAKGPVSLLPPLISILVFCLWTRNETSTRDTRVGWGLLRDLRVGRGLLVYLGVVLAWGIPALVRGGSAYIEQIGFRQTVTRYAEPWHHFAPPWYYLQSVLADFAPWILVLPAAVVAGWRFFGGRERRAFQFAICWVVVTLVFFSISSAKRSVYVLTMFPALALLVGTGLDALARRARESRQDGLLRGVSLPLATLALLLLGAVAWLPQAAARRPEAAILAPGVITELSALCAVIALGAALAAWLAYRGRLHAAVAALAGAMSALTIVAVLTVLPQFDAFKSARGLSEILRGRMAPGERYAIFPRLDSTFLFYTERFCTEVGDGAELAKFIDVPERVWVVARRDAYAKLVPAPNLTEVARDSDPTDGYLLLTNRP